ncbi:hypothetical protein A4A49_30737 [Nicotiana attenuata]|uniref:DUF4283 domain-containing protein n=1 Tax=Nicotiana attenuata TaxID=49451 RepID=A0A314LCV7_NICAT|nr:hypothetical protein A4A49_30737 [Nicotiana attenuata]
MEPPGSANPARSAAQTKLQEAPIQPLDGNTGKISYATRVTTAPPTSASSTHRGCEAVTARKTTHNGIPAIIFKAKDYYGVMAEECRRTIVGRFIKIRPQIEKIRSRFTEKFALKGSVKIGVYDNHNVFLDFTNDEDVNTIWFRRVIEIEGRQMWLQKWTPDFKPEEDIPIVPVWILLPQLPFHMHTWHYVKQVASAVGIPLEMDIATACRTRPSMAKMVEYEGVPKYCRHCKKLGHSLIECRVLEKKKQVEQREIERMEEKAQEGSEEADKLTDESKEKGKPQQATQQIIIPGDEASSRGAVGTEKRKERGGMEVNETNEKQYDKNENKPENAAPIAEKIDSTEEDNTMRKRTRRKKKKNGCAKKAAKKKPNAGQEEDQMAGTTHRMETSNNIDNVEKKTNDIPQTSSEVQGKTKQAYIEKSGSNIQRVEESILKSSSLGSEIKNQPGIQLVVDLGKHQMTLQTTNKLPIQTSNDDCLKQLEEEAPNSSEDEQVDSLIDEQEDSFQQHLKQVVDNEGLFPRGRSRGRSRCKKKYVNANVISMDDQQMTLRFESNNEDDGIFKTAVYAKCTTGERKDLWKSLVNTESQVDGTWCIGGDFNVILEPCEKLGGFYELVQEVWDRQVAGNPMWRLQQKLKALGRKLSRRSREVIGYVYKKVDEWERVVQRLEELDQSNNTE